MRVIMQAQAKKGGAMTDDPRPAVESFDEANREVVLALRSPDRKVRAVALAEASPMVDDELARELLRFARDPERGEVERGDALIALGPALETCSYDETDDGGLPDAAPEEEDWWDLPLSSAVYREATEALRRLYLDASVPKLVRRRALEAAVRAPRDWHRDAAGSAWRSDDPEWRLTAVFAMGHLPGFAAEIEQALDDQDLPIAREAFLAAGRAGIEGLAERLMDVAADRHADHELRLAAIEGLGELGPETAVEILEDLSLDSDREIADAAEEALEELQLLGGFDEDLDPGFDWEP